ncbi:DUF4434 domain-containing protein [Achromobacter sp. ACM03]|uniref:DUF4434 domain-containing protein n=1 Tax=Achromobacter sp. ACM03 TaxID=2769300 RepID=UPI0017818FE1|nr:DUF4434 domain-containing protein [Achromobacter sp. ACM03]MBD9434171.1 DUF4434 domain-containing protein [Achromobacter sp. ACM03]
MQASAPASTGRRRLLQGLGVAALAASLPACAPAWSVQSTFWQLWPSHLELSPQAWRERIAAMHALGFREIIIQWVGASGGAQPWQLPASTLALIFDEAERLGMGLQLGLPYDERWWRQLGNPDDAALAAFLQATQAQALAYAQASNATRLAAFRGWYIPYEIEQHSWAAPGRQALLAQWLRELSDPLVQQTGRVPAISTYHSKLPGALSLADLWNGLLDVVRVRPMLQDGVGVSGMAAYEALEPLHRMLLARRAPFDLIVELFEELPSERQDGTTFNARSADAARVRRQLRIARRYRAQRVVAFAADPWLIGPTPEAERLKREWPL